MPKEDNLAIKDCIGILYLVATPIGNLEDMTFRAVRILKEVDLIAAEDTRHTIKLLNHYEIKKPLVSYHEHNKVEKGQFLISKLLEGKNIALVSDAGTPGISDPGEDLVKLAANNGIIATMIPGPVAAVTALVLSALPTGKFLFEGFLPVNKKTRKEIILSLKSETRTIIFYEAPHKLSSTLKDLLEHLGNRKISIARELTKKFEEITRFTLQDSITKYENVDPKGEFVLVVEGANFEETTQDEMKKWDNISLLEHVEMYIEQGLSKKEATKKAADDRGLSKRDVYNSLLK
jgi:16S rRNA (cytidine1402-2'-O)-methyltransferase